MSNENQNSSNNASIEERVKKVLVDHLGVDAEKVTLESSIIDDLGADSLDVVEIVMSLEEEFQCEVADDVAEKMKTPKDIINFITDLQK